MKERFTRNYIVIANWMLNDLTELKGNELLIYALIFGLGGEDNKAKLSLNYIAAMLHITKKQVVRILDKLEQDFYIQKASSNLTGEKNEKNVYSIICYSEEERTKLHHQMGQNYTTLKINKIKLQNTHTYNKRDFEDLSRQEVIELLEDYKTKYQALCEIAKVKWVE